MAYEQFMWQNQVINDERVKFIRVRIFQVPENSKKKCNYWESGYTDGQFRGDLSERFTVSIFVGQLEDTKKNKVIKVRVFTTPKFKMETFYKLYKDFYEMDKPVYNYIQEALQKYINSQS